METKRYIDVAVLCQEYSSVDINCDTTNIIMLDEIKISKTDFLSIFFPHGENFGINRTLVLENSFLPYLSFEKEYRTLNKKPFFLLEKILENIENDLGISRTCFTTNSLMEITHEFTKIKTICDLNCCSVVSSLPWSIIEDLLNNYDSKSKIVFVVSIMFKTPTPNVKDNIFRFPYFIQQ